VTAGSVQLILRSPDCRHRDMDTNQELLQAVWEVIGEMEYADFQGDTGQSRRLERTAWRLLDMLSARRKNKPCPVAGPRGK
jgi:hypothetical protein